MSSLYPSQLRMSLLDRLIDEAPDLSLDPPRSRSEQVAAIHASFRRDLEAILNTRRRCVRPPASLKALQSSLPYYGVPDFVGMSLATPQERLALVRSLEETIRTFEPRFHAVELSLVQERDQLDRALRIRIEAVIRLEQVSGPIVFETTLDPATRTFSVTERDNV
jgi:type VI secretion system protein ImpF